MYYLGFLRSNTKDVVVFRAIKIPKKGDYRYFTGVMGPYGSEGEARKSLNAMRGQGYRENPAVSKRQQKFMCADLGRLRSGKKTVTGMKEKQLKDFCMKRKKNPAKVISHKQALVLTRKVIAFAKKLYKHEKAGVKGNPGVGYHDRKFLMYMKELEKYKVGSGSYIATLAKAYEHLKSAKDSRKNM